MWSQIQNIVEHGEMALGAFLDIEGAFDSMSVEVIIKAAEQHGIRRTIGWWVGSMLGSRKITATLARETLEGSVTKGCLQGGILSPLLWSLVVDKLIRGLNESGCYTMGYADGITILIGRKFPNTISELLQEAFGVVQQWCGRTLLSVRPQKMVIVPVIGRGI
jgi:hypothetical protein